jgi:hypothetical protein
MELMEQTRTSNQASLEEQLRCARMLRVNHGGQETHRHRFWCSEDLVLQHGRAFELGPKRFVPQPKACFQRSYALASGARSPWVYVEGFALNDRFGLAIPHGWVMRTDKPDTAYEVAWEHTGGAAYLGIPFRLDYIRKVFSASRRTSYGVIDAYWLGFPLLTGDEPIEKVIWRSTTRSRNEGRDTSAPAQE